MNGEGPKIEYKQMYEWKRSDGKSAGSRTEGALGKNRNITPLYPSRIPDLMCGGLLRVVIGVVQIGLIRYGGVFLSVVDPRRIKFGLY